MSKPVTKSLDLSNYQKSTFTLTFAVEILGINEWGDFEEGWVEAGPHEQGIKIQYQIYPGQNYDIDILIWPHVAKIHFADKYCWVRTWQFLERRWFAFSIRHAFPVRVIELQLFTATVNYSVGSGANIKNEKSTNICIPPLQFGERRYFAAVLEKEEAYASLRKFITQLIWSLIQSFIPASYLDGVFDVPNSVSDIRHQDAALYYVQEIILNPKKPADVESEVIETTITKGKKKPNETTKAKDVHKPKFEINLSGDSILCGTGRIIPFKTHGDKPTDLGEIIVLISSNNLPAHDDCPVVFVNVGTLFDIPMKEFMDLRWKILDEVHDSKLIPLVEGSKISFDDHHAIPLPSNLVPQVMAGFTEEFEIQLRGRRVIQQPLESALFGYQMTDRDFDLTVPKIKNTDVDFIIAHTKMDTAKVAHNFNCFVHGEYPLYPQNTSVKTLDREGVCTNDINGVRMSIEPHLVVQTHVVLMAQMTLEASVGLVGCKYPLQSPSFSRMFCLIKDSEALMSTLRYITTLNENVEGNEDLLTGFALDTGETAFLFVEGPKDGLILRVWDMTEDYYPILKPAFSCSVRYSTRIYPELLSAEMPFSVLKMFVPLGVLLACPPVYARPALPVPTKSAVLKIGRLVASKMELPVSRSDMPTSSELKSFRLELCVAPKPRPIAIAAQTNDDTKAEQTDQQLVTKKVSIGQILITNRQ